MAERTLTTYPLTPERKTRIKQAIAAGGRGAHSKLAKHVGISTGALTGMLSDASKFSQYVGPIYEYFNWDLPTDDMVAPAPTNEVDPDSPREILRRRLIRFREEVNYDQLRAASAIGIPYEQLERYELGTEEPGGTMLDSIAKVYGRRLNDFVGPEPGPPNLDNVPIMWWRGHPDVIRKISDDDRRRLDALIEEISSKLRPAKKQVIEHVKKASQRRKLAR